MTLQRPARLLPLAAAAALALLLSACGKVEEKLSEKAAEKMIESSLSKDGNDAKVSLSEGGIKTTITDKDGKTQHFEMGNAKVSEGDLGLPFYPGAQQQADKASRMASDEGSMVTTSFSSPDATDKIAGFYRDKLKARAGGKQFSESALPDGMFLLILTDEKNTDHTQVTITREGQASEVVIMRAVNTPKAS
ncbi:MAG: hypothetical protein QM765_11735 [Myxococcales bacterium]